MLRRLHSQTEFHSFLRNIAGNIATASIASMAIAMVSRTMCCVKGVKWTLELSGMEAEEGWSRGHNLACRILSDVQRAEHAGLSI